MSITVSKRLSNPHPIVATTLDYLDNKNLHPSFDRLITTGSHYLDVSISPDLLRRTMRIMDAIIKEGLKRGYEIHTGSYNSRSRTYFRIGEEKIYFRIYEIAQKRNLGYQDPKRPHWGYNYEIILTGNLRLMVCDDEWFYSVRCISDTKKAKIENRLVRFFKVVEELTEKSKIDRLAREAHHRKMKEESRNWAIRQQMLRDEENRREELEKHSEQFTKAQYIYQFIAEIDQQKSKMSLDGFEATLFDDWIFWARKHADSINPLNNTLNTIMESIKERKKNCSLSLSKSENSENNQDK